VTSEIPLHAFVAMPFGTKPGHDGAPIDFDRVYRDLIQPALSEAGYTVFRADQERRAGDIRTDMFQELLVADLVLADLTLDNPNVWYELGVRHALRARGVVLIQGPRPTQPFDTYTDRKLRYSVAAGGPDPATLAADRRALTKMARETRAADAARIVSPVYKLLDHLREPPWRELLLSQRNEFSEAYEAWQRRLEVARQKNRVGDLLVLAEETPTQALWLEGKRAAGRCLMKLRHFKFALEQFEAALQADPADKESRERLAVCLGRVGRPEEAREAAHALTDDYPDDPEAWALAGRVLKEDWVQRWRQEGATSEEMSNAAALTLAPLEEAIDAYQRGFIAQPAHYYSGINALTLRVLHRHLGGDGGAAAIDNLAGGVAWAALSAQQRNRTDYWARASCAELALLLRPLDSVLREFRAAVVAANRDWFALDSTLQTLHLLRDLGFRPDETAAAIHVVQGEIVRARGPSSPRQVLLFSGHMMDAPARPQPRFPPAMEAAAAQRIAAALDALGAGGEDIAFSQAASGGDLLFLEACQQRGVRCVVLLPFEEPEFITASVVPAANGEQWRERFFAMKERLADPLREMPAEIGPTPRGVNPFERCNRWLLYTALGWGVDKTRFVCLWNGGGGDGPGGTQHMYNEVKRRTGRVTWIDTRTL
jgi:tetratricopeptide (TPR) repeat protein